MSVLITTKKTAPSGAKLAYHRRFLEQEWFWKFYWIAFRGGREWLRPSITFSPITTLYGTETGTSLSPTGLSRHYTMLAPFPREENADYWRRIERARYDNECAPLVRQAVSHALEDEPIERTDGAGTFDPRIVEYLGDVDQTGQDRQSWMHWGLTLAAVLGHGFALTEIASSGAAVASAAAAQAAGERVYSAWFSPLEVPNWRLDERGAVEWMVFRYPLALPRGPFDLPSTELWRYRFWWRDHWEDWMTDPAWAEIDAGSRGSWQDEQIVPIPGATGPNPLGRVPVDVLYYQRDVSTRDPAGLGMLTDLAFLGRSLFNMVSLADQQLYEQTFSWLAVPGGHKLKRFVMAVQRFFGFDTGAGGGMPAFIAPPAEPTRLLLEVADQIRARMRAIAGFGRGVAEESIAARPAEAVAFESGGHAAELRRVRAEAQAFELRNLRTVAEWIGVDGSRFEVRYGRPQVSARREEAAPTAGAAEAAGAEGMPARSALPAHANPEEEAA